MISVVIPAYNEEKYIGAALQALTQQITDFPFEVIVVDNASSDKTSAQALQFTSKLKLRLITEPRKGRGAARQAGFAAAHGDIILSTDADATVPPDWVRGMYNALVNSRAVAVSGTCYIMDGSTFANTLFNGIQPVAMLLHRFVFGHFWLTGSNFGIYKTIYQQSGGFRPQLNSQEDTELSSRVQKLGKIKWVCDLPVCVSGRRFRQGIFSGLWDYVRSFFERWVLHKKDIILSDTR